MFHVWNFTKRKRMTTLLILAFCTAFLLFFKPLHIFNLFIQTEEVALTKGNKKDNTVALTFNISWGDEKVHDILNILQKHKIRATFFISGEWAEKHPQIVEKIQKNKHEIGMLGYRYQNYLDLEAEQVKKDILYAKEIFKKLGIEKVDYIRPPSGHFDKEIINLAENLDLEVIHWSVNPRDWENPGVDHIQKFILQNISKGDIVYLHASDSAKQTAKALEKAIPDIQKRNMTFATISELFNGVSMKKKLME